MTRTTNARLAGAAFLLYIVVNMAGAAAHAGPPTKEMLTLFTSFCALVLGVNLFAITRDEDEHLALLAMACRVMEAIGGQNAAIYFSVGSTLFCWLLLRGRMIPGGLAWLGVAASVLLVVALPLQHLGLFGGPTGWSSSLTWAMWLPMLVFEVAVAVWFLTKGVAARAAR
jgi:hypothetical protein